MIKVNTVTITTAGTRVQLASDISVITNIKFKAPSSNEGLVAIGDSTVSMTKGYELSAGQTLELPRVELSEVYVDAATNGDKVSWIGND